MLSYTGKQIVVIGPGKRGAAACRFLIDHGAGVSVLRHPTANVAAEVEAELAQAGVAFLDNAQGRRFDLGVVDPGVPVGSRVVEDLRGSGTEVVSEMDLGLQHVRCLCVAIAGTNGKSTTAGLLESILKANDRKTVIAGHAGSPICSVIDQTKDLDYLLLNVSAAQLEISGFFRPAVAVLLNSAPDSSHSPEELQHIHARVFQKQQVFDWAIVQSQTLQRLKELGIPVPAKVITFSSTDSQAELYLDRGLVQGRLSNWAGPLLNLDLCRPYGHHAVEDIMAALAVGHVLRLPLDRMAEAVQSFTPGPHRFSIAGEVNEITFIDDSKATNLDALETALLGCQPVGGGRPNILLIAGGKDNGGAFHDIAPLISRRVKQAFLIGEAGEKIRAAWSLFTPCTVAQTLLEAVHEAAKNAVSGDVVLLSPACSSFDQFQNFSERGEMFCQAVKSISGGAFNGNPHMDCRNSAAA